MVDRLRELKENAKMTVQQIADKSGVPVSTVSRILSGETANPQFQTVCDIISAMGGSVDEFIGISKVDKNCDFLSTEKVLRQVIEDKNKTIKHKNRWIYALVAMLIFVFAAVVFVLIYDITHPDMGYVRY